MASAPQSSSIVRIGVLGCGNVGAAFIQLVERQADVIEARTGVRLQIARVAVRNVSRDREVQLPDGVVTRDAESVVKDPTVDLIVEVIGGIEPARELIATAIANGKPVVTANKELLANVGHELWAQSDAAGIDLLFEAAVAGGNTFADIVQQRSARSAAGRSSRGGVCRSIRRVHLASPERSRQAVAHFTGSNGRAFDGIVCAIGSGSRGG